MSRSARCLGAACCLALGACATIPRDRYGVNSLTLEGVEQVDPESLRACLATQERDYVSIRTAEPECGEPPFDRTNVRLPLWRWGWTKWKKYDQAILQRDVRRIERWYRARGFYDARVVRTRLDPPSALNSDRVDEGQPSCERYKGDQGCTVDIEIGVREGKPVLVRSLVLTGDERLASGLRKRLRAALALAVGARFDEALYEASKREIKKVLTAASYAHVQVGGLVTVDPELRQARVRLWVEPGVRCVFGKVRVTGQKDLSPRPILGAAYLIEGDPYDEKALLEAQQAVYSLGIFSSVEVEAKVPDDPKEKVVPVEIRVVVGRRFRWGVGGGVQSGHYISFQGGVENEDVPQWDVHLLGIVEDRNFLGGLRRLRIEERPRLIFNNVFPRAEPVRDWTRPLDTSSDPILGNLTLAEFRQPSFIERRTTLVVGAQVDLGPDPFFREDDYYRLDFDARIAPERTFFGGKLYVSAGLHGNILRQINDAEDVPADYGLMFFEQQIRLDLRDDRLEPTKGAFLGVSLHEAGYLLPSSWDYVRVTPEARGYVPLPLGLVIAARFGLGAMFITDTVCGSDQGDCFLDDVSNSRELGPFRYRLRGGGPSSNRGFPAGRLGEGPPGVSGLDGGLRRWEATLELRARLANKLRLAVFWDFGDVHQGNRFRFDHLNTTFGGGLRYRTPVGPLRLDVGWLVPKWRVVGTPDPPDEFRVALGRASFPGAVHLTFGEAF